MTLKSFLYIFLFIIFLPSKVESQSYTLRNAEFYKGELGGVWEVWRTKNPHLLPEWKSVLLPHCYNRYDVLNSAPGYYQGVAWYRLVIPSPKIKKNSRIILKIDGGGPNLEIYIFNRLLGKSHSAYQESTFDITNLVKWVHNSPSLSKVYDGKIPIAFRCDNSRDLNQIPSNLNDFPINGGLYRKIEIITKPEIFIKKVITECNVDSLTNIGSIKVQANIFNPKKYNLDGQIIFKLESKNTIIRQQRLILNHNTITFNIDSLDNIKLWSPSNPNLYKLKLILKTSHGIDSIINNVGFKYFKFINNGPFYLNGKRVLLKGVHLHEDHADVGSAVPYKIHEKEIKLIKMMGANFIRLAHYQQSSKVLDLCDQYGLLVWEEIPWSRGGLGGLKHKNNIERFLTKMIGQHYNHVSIIIWGLGNEIDLYGDFNSFNKDSVRQFLTRLNLTAKKLDPNRMTALRRCEFAKDIPDIYSPSIWAGWYSGSYKEYENMIKMKYTDVKHFIHAEWGVASIANRHSLNPYVKNIESSNGKNGSEENTSQLFNQGEDRYSKDGDWSETYACDLVDWHLNTMEKMPWFTGAIYWSFKDFATPLRKNNPIPHINLKGIVQRDLTKKETYYVFQSYWTTKPMVHIYGHEWKKRWLRDDQYTSIKVYSNCKKVELLVNNITQGIKNRDTNKFPASGLEWILNLKLGENAITAIGTSAKGKQVIDSIHFFLQKKKWGNPNKLLLTKKQISNNLFYVEVKLIDREGNTCLNANNIVVFNIIGNGKLIIDQGTVNGSQRIELTNGKAGIYVKINDGKSILGVMSDKLDIEYIVLGNS